MPEEPSAGGTAEEAAASAVADKREAELPPATGGEQEEEPPPPPAEADAPSSAKAVVAIAPCARKATKLEAIERGLRYMERYFEADSTLLTMLGEQCVGMFFDVFKTHCDEAVCNLAKDCSLRLLCRLEHHMLTDHYWAQPATWTATKFLDVVAMVRYSDLGWSPEPLLRRADMAFKHLKGRILGLPGFSPSVRKKDLHRLKSEHWFDIVLGCFALEYCDTVHPGRFKGACDFGAGDMLSALRKHRLAPPPWKPSSDFQESFYLATHVTYCLSGYTSNTRSDAPWLFDYIENSLVYWMGEAKKRDAGQRGGAEDGLVFVDLDAIAEAVDVLRGLQLDDDNSSLVRECTDWLLSKQCADGSWPQIWHPDDPLRTRPEHARKSEAAYDQLHPVWVGTYALCDRLSVADATAADGGFGAKFRAKMAKEILSAGFKTYEPKAKAVKSKGRAPSGPRASSGVRARLAAVVAPRKPTATTHNSLGHRKGAAAALLPHQKIPSRQNSRPSSSKPARPTSRTNAFLA